MPCCRNTQPMGGPADDHVTLEAAPLAPVELQMSVDPGDSLSAMS